MEFPDNQSRYDNGNICLDNSDLKTRRIQETYCWLRRPRDEQERQPCSSYAEVPESEDRECDYDLRAVRNTYDF
jgi:hypothetical protein